PADFAMFFGGIRNANSAHGFTRYPFTSFIPDQTDSGTSVSIHSACLVMRVALHESGHGLQFIAADDIGIDPGELSGLGHGIDDEGHSKEPAIMNAVAIDGCVSLDYSENQAMAVAEHLKLKNTGLSSDGVVASLTTISSRCASQVGAIAMIPQAG